MPSIVNRGRYCAPTEERGRRRREAERRRVERAFVLPDVRLLEALPAAADVQQREFG